MNVDDAALSIHEWTLEGVDFPEGLTAPMLTEEWNRQLDSHDTMNEKGEEKEMKASEIIEKYADAITSAMLDLYKKVIACDGRIQYKLYVWDDGEVEYLECVPGDNSWLQPKDAETRSLYYVCKVSEPCFDPAAYLDHPLPEDETEREEEVQAVREWMISEYEQNIPATLEAIIEDEKYEENSFPPYRG